MIGRLVGKLVELDGTVAIIDTLGVGYEVEIPDGMFDETPMGTECTLYTQQIIQQDQHSLYAFANKQMREFFRVLIRAPGVGPKSALSILSSYSASQLIRIVSERDTGALTQVKGIGKKGAERILMELADRIQTLPYTLAHATQASSSIQGDAEKALVQLGYRHGVAKAAIESAWHDGITLEELIRAALQRAAVNS